MRSCIYRAAYVLLHRKKLTEDLGSGSSVIGSITALVLGMESFVQKYVVFAFMYLNENYLSSVRKCFNILLELFPTFRTFQKRFDEFVEYFYFSQILIPGSYPTVKANDFVVHVNMYVLRYLSFYKSTQSYYGTTKRDEIYAYRFHSTRFFDSRQTNTVVSRMLSDHLIFEFHSTGLGDPIYARFGRKVHDTSTSDGRKMQMSIHFVSSASHYVRNTELGSNWKTRTKIYTYLHNIIFVRNYSHSNAFRLFVSKILFDKIYSNTRVVDTTHIPAQTH